MNRKLIIQIDSGGGSTGGILFNTSFYIGLSTAFLIISVLNLIESLLSKIAILLT